VGIGVDGCGIVVWVEIILSFSINIGEAIEVEVFLDIAAEVVRIDKILGEFFVEEFVPGIAFFRGISNMATTNYALLFFE